MIILNNWQILDRRLFQKNDMVLLTTMTIKYQSYSRRKTEQFDTWNAFIAYDNIYRSYKLWKKQSVLDQQPLYNLYSTYNTHIPYMFWVFVSCLKHFVDCENFLDWLVNAYICRVA